MKNAGNNKKDKVLRAAIVILLIIILVLLCIFTLQDGKKKSELGDWDGKNNNIVISDENEHGDEQIAFQSFALIKITKEKPYISLYNLPGNTVNMRYNIYIIKEDGTEELLYKTEVDIGPDKALQCEEVYNKLDNGEYNARYEKLTTDIETGIKTTTNSENGILIVKK